MKNVLRGILIKLAPLLDLLVVLPTMLACFWLRFVRKLGVSRLPLVRKTFYATGIFPIRDHYYEPLFNPERLSKSLRQDRELPGINWHVEGQKELLKKFRYQNEILEIKNYKGSELRYSFGNDTFRAGDSEYLYNMIRHFKPRRLIEIGSGNSTLMAIEAIRKNKQESPNYTCEHICIEPFERPWLEKLDIKLVRELVENVDAKIFSQLGENDILFIDSSHMIRPQGDVLCEYLAILPKLNKGVLVHVHDIFSPKDYLDTWVFEDMKMWNEQYLLEAFLSHNQDFKVVGALNLLKHQHTAELSAACPVFGSDPKEYEPGSFWIQRVQ